MGESSGVSSDKKADLASQAIGKGLGAVSGGVGAVLDAKANKRSLDEYIRQQAELGKTVSATEQARLAENIASNKDVLQGYGQNTSDYLGALKSADYSRYDVQAPEDFSYDMGAETRAQMNPAIADIIKASTDSVQQSAANRGSLFSGAAAKGIANASAGIQAQEYDKAAQRAQQGYQNKYGAFMDKFANTLKANETNKGNYTSGMQAQGQLFNVQQGAQEGMTNRANAVTDAADTSKLNIQQNTGTAQAQRKGINSSFANFAQGALSGLAG